MIINNLQNPFSHISKSTFWNCWVNPLWARGEIERECQNCFILPHVQSNQYFMDRDKSNFVVLRIKSENFVMENIFPFGFGNKRAQKFLRKTQTCIDWLYNVENKAINRSVVNIQQIVSIIPCICGVKDTLSHWKYFKITLDNYSELWDHLPMSNPNQETCNTCGRSKSSPFRVYDSHGKCIEGCVDAIHTGHLVSPSESSFWHNRPEAKRIRASWKRFIASH